jgi:hypothetical protein
MSAVPSIRESDAGLDGCETPDLGLAGPRPVDREEIMDTAQSGISRRAFLGAGLAAGAAVATGRLEVPSWAAARTEPWIEASIPELQRLMARRRLTSRELTL